MASFILNYNVKLQPEWWLCT